MDLLAAFSTAKRSMAKTPSPKGSVRPGDMDILAKLKQEHEEVAALLKTLVDSGKGAERKALVKKIRKALVPHLRAEEKVVYDAIVALKDKDAKIDGNEGYVEHHLGDKVLGDLVKMTNAMSPEFSATAKVLKELVAHHVKEEEDAVWSDLRRNFDADARIAMNRAFEAAKKKVKV